MNRQKFIRSSMALAALATGAGLLVAPAQAQTAAWPNKPIRMFVNFPAGGSPDIVARAVAKPLTEALGQTINIDNRSGAGGIVGADAAAKSPPDGYNFLLSSGSALAIVPLLNNKLPFDPNKDLVPVAGGARLELFLVVRSDLPINNYADFVRYTKANPGKLSYGSPGNGTSPHIAGEMMKSQAGIFTVHIPYRGSGAVLQDLLGGRVDYAFDPGVAFPHIKSGKLRLIAVGSAKRSGLFPETPTLDELGLKGFDAGTTHGFWAPAGTPADVIGRMNTEINRALAQPDVVTAIRALGAEPHVLSPAQFGQVILADRKRYEVIVRERKIAQD
ncbi:MAG: tripartite tricarboxylate transporter substrate binding protein [Aquabacterium sp.]|nr:tripartite tricarboxylate transporter substrate binding protein [Aquabacterium sp.]